MFPAGPSRILSVAGTTFIDDKSVFYDILPDNDVQLVAEPENKFDPYAVRVEAWAKDRFVKVGYIPKDVARKYDFSKTMSGYIEQCFPPTGSSSPGIRFSLLSEDEQEARGDLESGVIDDNDVK